MELKDMSEMQKAMDRLNQLYRQIVGSSHRNPYVYWRIPRKWKGTRYRFGYTPWRIECRGRVGFFAVKYRETKDKIKLVKAIRFGKRKKARERSLEWHKAYYERET